MKIDHIIQNNLQEKKNEYFKKLHCIFEELNDCKNDK